jgi:alpha-glucosidase
MRPLFLEFPDDANVTGMEDEFMFGDDLLVAPVLHEGQIERDVYLPKGNWFDYWTGQKFTGGKTIQLPVTLASIPMFVRGGGFIFRQPVVQYTGQMPGNPLRVLIAPAKKSAAALYEDDGESLDYRSGQFMKRRFEQTSDDSQTTIAISAPEGSYRPAARDLFLETWMNHEPQTVSIQTGAGAAKIPLPQLSADALTNSPDGWTFTNDLLTVKSGDVFEPRQFVIAH